MFRVVSTEAMEHITAPHSPMLRPTTKTFFDEPLDLGQWTGSNETTMVQIERKSASNAFTLMDWLKSTRSPTPPCSVTLSSVSDNGCSTDDISSSQDEETE